MKSSKFFRKAAIAALIAGPLTAAMATNGYFSHGYGMKAKGMAGASVASTDNAFAGANNPAAAAWAGNRVEAGVDIFMPVRSMYRSSGTTYSSGSEQFFVPEFGWNFSVNDKIGAGVTVYGNGGMNTDYPYAATNAFGINNSKLGMNLEQLVIAPTVAYKLNSNHSLGLSPLIISQNFSAVGANAATTPSPGTEASNGVGLRVGYLGKMSDTVSIGASYSPKTSMSKFSKYTSLFLGDGNFDIPENYTLGANIRATPGLTLAVDYQQINYAGVISVGTPSALGGFGWKSIDVWKLGAQWAASSQLTLRAGLNVGGNPISTADASMNTLAPGVTTTHYTLGGTYALSKATELTIAYMYAPENSVSGPNSGGTTDTIKMSQSSLGIQFGWKY